MSRRLEPAGSDPGQRPFEDLPFDLAEVADRVLDTDSKEEVTYQGVELILVADTYLAAVEDPNKVADMERAWKIERVDGRQVYIWSIERVEDGVYGLGKPSRN